MTENKTPKVTYRDVLSYYAKQSLTAGWRTPVIFITRIILVLVMIYEPIFIKDLIDILTSSSPNIHEVYRILQWILWLAIITFLGWRLVEYAIVDAQLVPMKVITDESFAYIHRHSTRWFGDKMSGKLLKIIKQGSSAFVGLYDTVVFSLITPIGVSLGSIIVLFGENILLGRGMLGWIILFVSMQIRMYRKKAPLESASTRSVSARSGYTADTLSNAFSIQHSGSLPLEVQSHDIHTSNMNLAHSRNWFFGNRIYAISSLILGVAFVGGLYLLVGLWQQGQVSVGLVVLFILYMGTVDQQLFFIGSTLKRFVQLAEDGKEFLEILLTPHEVVNLPHAQEIVITQADIVFDHVTFGYTHTHELEDFSLTIPHGQHIGLVGESGAGKSTLTKLLLRLYDIQGGSITIGGNDITGFTLDALRSQISYVPQEPILFHRSLRDNITYGHPDATEEEVIYAARRAQAHEFISSLPQGYDSLVGERGVKLSGGQRQRIAIARAILHDAPIIILDEATSSLDSVTEGEIQKAMQEVMRGRTAIVVAHRLGTVQHLDRIIVLDGGKIIETGDHKELMKMKGKYYTMVGLQSGF